ncbi:D-arabinono-1,4-lactone oxidase [Gryllotalpicola protaetiae]|uniref:FAD-binding protein n=1 Tax=Gryllotalpicola protaetiae TaxID=2419771 RepID=A0A387BNP5_9MICO|nr:D-arabinono-1,4-lactone oxidase [Gryllotalpicola protaetiae]AYG02616.1 FAD-binding protein [Gryllotalpicola protaetiae]
MVEEPRSGVRKPSRPNSLRAVEWRNWSRTESVHPIRVETPDSPEAVQRAVQAAAHQGLTIKAIGAGHSFTGIAVAEGVQLLPDRLQGVVAVDEASARVTLAAGTRLWQLPRLLTPYGLALQNMGDIDRQSIAGATSTGTHGTGGSFGGLATQITAVTLVTGTGELLRVSETENAELLPAARLGLGALGIVVDVTIQCVPAFALHAVERPEPLPEVLDDYLERSAREDHFEFYWFPHTQVALTKTNTRLPGDAPRHPLGLLDRVVGDELLSNDLYRGLCALATITPAMIPGVNRLATRLTGDREFTDASPKVFVTNRSVRFRETEYALPRAAVPEALRELDRLIERRGWRISFPVEVRSAAADDNWLSTAYGRETGYIAVHRYYRETRPDQLEYFAAAEKIMVEAGGRPHWGKLHTRDAGFFAQAYPRFDDFLAARDRLDPGRVFRNPYLDRVLG